MKNFILFLLFVYIGVYATKYINVGQEYPTCLLSLKTTIVLHDAGQAIKIALKP